MLKEFNVNTRFGTKFNGCKAINVFTLLKMVWRYFNLECWIQSWLKDSLIDQFQEMHHTSILQMLPIKLHDYVIRPDEI